MLLGIIIIIVGVVVYNLIESTNKNPEVSIEEIVSNISPVRWRILLIILMILAGLFYE